MELSNLTFRGGVHFEDYKSLSNGSEPIVMPSPDEVTLMVSQHIGKPAKPIVKKGDQVKLGQRIAEAQGFVSAHLHASVSGEVVDVMNVPTPDGGRVPAIVIRNDHQDTPGYEPVNRRGQDLSSEEIIQYIQDAGIVGMGGAGFPAHVKLSPPKDSPVDTIIVNGSECEPYLTCDEVQMRKKPARIVEGLKLAMKAAHATQGYIAIEDNKPKAIEAIRGALQGESDLKLAVLKTKYPQGDERRLVEAITGHRIKQGAIPASVGCVVSNVSTVLAIVDAVYEGKPSYERLVTVTGHAIKEPKNVLTRFGTSIHDLVEFAGGYASAPGKIITGGPMMGVAMSSDREPLGKRNNGVVVLTEQESRPKEVEPCIRCGRCVDVCPTRLEPLMLANYSRIGDYDTANAYYISQCIECGSCSYICPSHRPLLEWIRFGKQEVRNLSRK